MGIDRILSYQIDSRVIEPVSNSLIFRPCYRMIVRFMLPNDSISLIGAITSCGLLKKANLDVPFTAHLRKDSTKEEMSHWGS